MIKYGFFIAGLLICSFTNYGQVSPIYEKVIPPSPEATSIAKYGNTPISYNTGTPNISIPVYTIKGEDIELPISLTYDTKGHKVEDVASWVGLGWTLSAGGVIARTVRGRPDEHNFGYFNQRDRWETLKDQVYNTDNFVGHAKYQFQTDVASGKFGLTPDAFTFNFGGYSGTITFKYINDGSGFEFYPMVSPFQDIKIQHPFEGTTNGNWIISTPDGLRYTFSDKETNDTRSTNGLVVSAWYLSTIESINTHEKVIFNYGTNGTHVVDNGNMYQVSTTTLQGTGNSSSCEYPDPYIETDDPDHVTTLYLSSIFYYPDISIQNDSYIKVTLNSVAGRSCERVVNYTPILRKLNNILVNSHQPGGASSLIKNVDFEYGVYGNPADCNSSNRLRLDAVTESGKPPYQFEYSSNTLPEYGFMSDHWGYWNGEGRPANNSFIPKLSREYEKLYINNGLASANRETSHIYSLVGLLSKITYPTGGSTMFEFETHSGQGYIDNYHLPTVISVTAKSDIENHGTMSADELAFRELWNDGDTEIPDGMPNVRLMRFTIDEGQYVKVSYSISPSANYQEPIGARLYNWPVVDKLQPISFNPAIEKFLPAGNYVLVAMVGENHNGVTVSASMDYYKVVDNYFVKDRYYGGARIKKITDYDPVDPDNPVITEFRYYKDYAKFLTTGNSGDGLAWEGPLPTDNNGTVGGTSAEEEPQPTSSATIFYSPEYFVDDICDGQLIVSAYSSHPFGLIKGHHIGYSEVAVIRNGGENYDNGITIYKFINSPNPDVRDLQKEEAHYDADLNLLNKTIYEYADSYSENTTGFIFKIDQVRVLFDDGEGSLHYYYFSDKMPETNYNYGAFWRHLIKQSDYSYTLNGGEYLKETSFEYGTENYNFKNQVHYQFLTKQTETINGGVLNSYYLYPPQYSGTLYTQMINDYNYSHLIKSYSEVEPENGTPQVIAGNSYDYQKIGDRYVPEKEYVLNRETLQYETNRVFAHDTKGKLVGIRNLRNGINTAYLCDARGRNLVAAVKNALPEQVEYCSFEMFTRSTWTIGNTIEDTDAVTGNLVKDLNSGTVTFAGGLAAGTYKVTLFAKNGSVTINGVQKNAASEWTFLTWEVSNGAFAISGTATIDEVRVMPLNAYVQFNTFKVDDFIGVNSKSDPNGISTYFKYDSQHRLDHIRDNNKNITTKYEYGYYND
ncbi:hypothetical protein JMN32_22485 [Fulvivirga sp. 29W222]|uniref:YD repeat-containing protein n=1 Tax=Fulvivirga marina TaxID=2494733 RepID=A0A937G622_9BACT|nr:hypothetical protein [Fulvivirga marina]MBL6449096.1 hypothetical protein [Fulvivirga marina]